MERAPPNLDPATVRGFGFEWARFDQSEVDPEELRRYFDAYFSLFPWETLPPNPVGFDLGCGSGRWATFVAPRVGVLHCIDASREAIDVAKAKLHQVSNCHFTVASVDDMGLAESSMDFGYSLGVLHHVPDTAAALRKCVAVLRPGAPLLVYLYYALDGRSRPYRLLWRCSAALRSVISRLPNSLKAVAADLLAVLVYFPISRFAGLLERAGVSPVDGLPLAYYRRSSMQTLRTDALDRFGTRLEKRFTREEIGRMLADAGLVDIRFRESAPYWCAVGVRAK